jgi:non-heme chloroperoxidase
MRSTEAFSGTAETDDGAFIYYRVRGSGSPLVFVHGWAMSGNFWKKQVEGISGNYQVITIDLRAHGNSSKIMHGHTIPRYAGDVRTVMRKLQVENATLIGWSLGGPVVLSYWEQFGAEDIRALGLVDMTPFPFSPADWNSHSLSNYDYNNMNAFLLAVAENRRDATTAFINRMFRSGQAGPELEWMLAESLKTPTAAAVAIYSDYLMRDYSEILKTIDVPVVIFAAGSQIFPRSVEMAKYVNSRIPNSALVIVENAGHLLFYENSEKFNSALTDFLHGLR